MINKLSKNKLFKLFIIFLIVFLFQIFPNKKEYELKTKSVLNENKYHEIYLLDKNNYLSKTNIVVNSIELDKLSIELIESLIIDGKYIDRIPNGFRPLLPSITKINSLKIDNDLIIVDFSNLFYEVDIFEEEKIIESLIYTLTSLKPINRIQIKIDGVELNKLPISNKNIDTELTREYGINKETNINSIKDIKSVTIYYISKFNDNSYYVPVTKYVNSDKNKINIIIEELSSRMSYNSNLMSYLNSNAQLLDYTIADNKIDLNFNEFLFDNKDKKIVLEEVIYSISYSINDTLNIKNVTFLINNKEIKR